MYNTIAGINIVCAIISAKWAMELEYSQLRQILFLIGGLILGPIMLLILYIYLLRKKLEEKKTTASITE
jgi:hypothetical protein